jgi:hypothetical protein
LPPIKLAANMFVVTVILPAVTLLVTSKLDNIPTLVMLGCAFPVTCTAYCAVPASSAKSV